MTDLERAEQTVATWTDEMRGVEFSTGAKKLLALLIVEALTLARSEGREEGVKDLSTRRDVEGLLGRQPAAPTGSGYYWTGANHGQVYLLCFAGGCGSIATHGKFCETHYPRMTASEMDVEPCTTFASGTPSNAVDPHAGSTGKLSTREKENHDQPSPETKGSER